MASTASLRHSRHASSQRSVECALSRRCVMIETNIRIVNPGQRLYVWTRRARVIGPDLSHDLLERACGRLRYQHGMAAIPCAGNPPTLLVATNRTIPHIRLADEDWALEVEDTGEESQKLTFTDVDSRE